MNRGDVFLVRLDPVEGSEQAGIRPCVIVTRNAINRHSPVIMVTPFTDAANITRQYPSDVLIRAPEGGLAKNSVALIVQTRAIAKTRLVRRLGTLSPAVMNEINEALRITLDLE